MTRTHEDRWWTLAVVCTAIFMLLLDITVVNVALPDIERSLGASFRQLQWVIDAYSLALATCVLTAGTLADRFGRRRLFVIGLGVFVLASAACGAASTPALLIGARAVQGIGGAIMFATSLALISQSFEGRERGTAFGIWGATTGAAVAIGPLVGGALTTVLDWRFIFFVNLPIGAGALLLALTRLAEGRDPKARRPDWIGLATLTSGLFLLVYGLLEAEQRSWGDPFVLGCLAAAVILLAGFVVAESRQAQAMLDVSLFRVPTFTGAQVAAFTVSAAVFSTFLYLTLFLQNIRGYSPLEAGLRQLPISLMSFLMAPLAGRLSARVPVRLLLAGGLLVAAAGALLISRLSPGDSWTVLLPGFVLLGAGIGLVNPPLANVAVGVAPRERSGMASGTNNTFRQVGIATGIAALGTVFQSRLAGSLEAGLAGTPAASRSGQLSEALSAAPLDRIVQAVPPPARDAVRQQAEAAFVASLDRVYLISAAIAVVGAVLAGWLVRGRDLGGAPAPAPAPERAAAPAGPRVQRSRA
jgi:EmrB/QacA subfamily drug resistance transporter